MSARIYSPSKTAMSSGKAKAGRWVLEFERTARRGVDPLMGYTSNSDMRSTVRLQFASKEQAVAYAEKQGIAAKVEEPQGTKRRVISYSDNFKFDRRVPWTH